MQALPGKRLPFVAALVAWSVLCGCTQFQTHGTLASLLDPRAAPGSPPQSTKPDGETGSVPREPSHIKRPPPVIDLLEVLKIEVVATNPETGKEEQLAKRPISGTFVVRPDGTVRFGEWGSVRMAGTTPDEAEVRVREHIAKARGADSNAGELRVTVDVSTSNTERYYVVTYGGQGGDQAYAFPLTGTETVLDAIANTPGLPEVVDKLSVRIGRKSPYKGSVLTVDWHGIIQQGITDTNYQLQPGDRIDVTITGK
jgi:polysaccharide biosynthesis/export protein